MLFALFLTVSRTGIVAFLFGAFYLLIHIKKKSTVLLTLLFAFIFLYLLKEGIVARLAELSYTGWGTRLWELKLGFKQFLEAPFTGIGLRSYRPKLRALGYTAFYPWIPVIHNNYLKFLVELGIPGFCLLVWFCVKIVKVYIRNLRLLNNNESSPLYWLNLGFGSCLLSTAIFALPLGVYAFNHFWIFLSLFAILSKLIFERIPNSYKE